MTSLDFYRNRRVCVTGATGLIGSYAVKLLVQAGAKVTAIRHKRYSEAYVGGPINDFTELAERHYTYDLLDPKQALLAVDGEEIVVNCAGITGGIGIVKQDPISYVGPATTLACNVIHACHLSRARLGFLSSTTVYAAQDTPVVERPEVYLDEPYRLYWGIGWSKRYLIGKGSIFGDGTAAKLVCDTFG